MPRSQRPVNLLIFLVQEGFSFENRQWFSCAVALEVCLLWAAVTEVFQPWVDSLPISWWNPYTRYCSGLFFFQRSWVVPPTDDINRFNWFPTCSFLEEHRATRNSQGLFESLPGIQLDRGSPVLGISHLICWSSFDWFLRGHLTDFSRKRRLSGLVSQTATPEGIRIWRDMSQLGIAKSEGSKDWEGILFLANTRIFYVCWQIVRFQQVVYWRSVAFYDFSSTRNMSSQCSGPCHKCQAFQSEHAARKEEPSKISLLNWMNMQWIRGFK